ncbi:hypothetical protein M885DRAFT_563172 [Pelagophyceae sp. CCMP2097]|nr:hypothetical protein M885DRAFT_563172 [Pelagophyceae sp. CCMP2097]
MEFTAARAGGGGPRGAATGVRTFNVGGKLSRPAFVASLNALVVPGEVDGVHKLSVMKRVSRVHLPQTSVSDARAPVHPAGLTTKFELFTKRPCPACAVVNAGLVAFGEWMPRRWGVEPLVVEATTLTPARLLGLPLSEGDWGQWTSVKYFQWHASDINCLLGVNARTLASGDAAGNVYVCDVSQLEHAHHAPKSTQSRTGKLRPLPK